MDIERIIEEKQIMEKQILDFVRETFNNFEELTGLQPNNIDFDIIHPQELGMNKPQTVITSCNIKVEV